MPVAAETKFSEVLQGSDTNTLFVLVHGLEGDVNETWNELQPEFLARGNVVKFNYDAPVISNASPSVLAAAMADELQRIVARQVAARKRPYAKIVLVGHSIGALLVRRLYLIASERSDSWTLAKTRVVLLAGMNRGWDVTGKKPMDMSAGRRMSYWVGSWFARLSSTGALIMSTETGSPFVANLRLDWMRHFRAAGAQRPIVVQLLGDIDDRVSSADNEDLRAAGGDRFYWLRVRGTAASAEDGSSPPTGPRSSSDGTR
jgi:pimeloyl-ACP methyl ester carboxylesterase